MAAVPRSLRSSRDECSSGLSICSGSSGRRVAPAAGSQTGSGWRLLEPSRQARPKQRVEGSEGCCPARHGLPASSRDPTAVLRKPGRSWPSRTTTRVVGHGLASAPGALELSQANARRGFDEPRHLISPHPRVVLAVEGEAEEIHAPLVWKALGYPEAPELFRLLKLGGVGRDLEKVAALAAAPLVGEKAPGERAAWLLIKPPDTPPRGCRSRRKAVRDTGQGREDTQQDHRGDQGSAESSGCHRRQPR